MGRLVACISSVRFSVVCAFLQTGFVPRNQSILMDLGSVGVALRNFVGEQEILGRAGC